MASCDDDFSLIGDEAHHHASNAQHHHHHQQAAFSTAHRYVAKAVAPIRSHLSAIPSPKDGVGATDVEDYGDAFTAASTETSKPFHDVNPHHHCFADDDPGGNPFGPQPAVDDEDEDANNKSDRKSRGAAEHQHAPAGLCRSETKRNDRDELSDGGSPYWFSNKKSRVSSVAPSSSGDYRKDREEWSDSAIACLLDAYTDKYVQLNRGNLRGRDWEDVATIVSERCDKQKSGKSVEQCKNKIDNLKKRYKAECQRLSSGSLSVSHWPWFKKLEQIVLPSSSSKLACDDDKSGALAASASVARQTKRCSFSTPSPVGVTSTLKMKQLSNPRWKRVVMKITGASLAGNGAQNVDPKVAMLIAREIGLANHAGVEVAVVVGGRNFFSGDTWIAATGIDRATAYQIGMMASVMNSILLQASLEKIGIPTRVQTAFMMQEIAEPYTKRRAIRHLEKGRVVIFGGIGAGTGSPLFTTDTAAALKASEMNADALLKGTSVDDIYDCHSRNSNGVAFEHISFRDLVSRGFAAMDMTAITFCEENNIPVVLFNLLEPGNISRALCGDQIGTLVDQSGRIS